MRVLDAAKEPVNMRQRIVRQAAGTHPKRKLLLLQRLWCYTSIVFRMSRNPQGTAVVVVSAYGCSSLVMMGSRRSTKRSDLKKKIFEDEFLPSSRTESNTNNNSNLKSLNQGKGQEILGVTLPSVDKEIKGWVVGENNQKVACANVNGRYYAVQGECPRCAFDLYRGKVVDVGRSNDPHVGCPTCGATFSLKTGKRGPVVTTNDSTGFLTGFVNKLAKSATIANASKDAKAYVITVDSQKKIYCKEVMLNPQQ